MSLSINAEPTGRRVGLVKNVVLVDIAHWNVVSRTYYWMVASLQARVRFTLREQFTEELRKS